MGVTVILKSFCTSIRVCDNSKGNYQKVGVLSEHTLQHKYKQIYRIASFYRKDFNIAFGSICNIKIRVIFVKRDILCKCPTVIPALFFKQLNINPP